MKKRMLALLLSGIMTAGLLAGCGNSGSGSGTGGAGSYASGG